MFAAAWRVRSAARRARMHAFYDTQRARAEAAAARATRHVHSALATRHVHSARSLPAHLRHPRRKVLSDSICRVRGIPGRQKGRSRKGEGTEVGGVEKEVAWRFRGGPKARCDIVLGRSKKERHPPDDIFMVQKNLIFFEGIIF